MRKSLQLLVNCIAIWLFLATTAFGGTISGKVVGVADGDTITVLENRKQVKIRLYGIDTPEKHQDFGQKAKQHTSNLVFGKKVNIQSITTDRYGRVVGLVFNGNGCVNEDLIKSGLAWVYRKYCTNSQCNDWLQLEKQARAGKIGLWSHNNPIPPWDFRRGKSQQSGQVSKQAQTRQVAQAYHGNIKSGVFHRSGCRYFNCKNCTAVFQSRGEAIKAGYRPCKVCRP